MYYVYFMESEKNGKIYVGSTEKAPGERVKDHNHGSNKWSKENGPFILKYYERYHCKQDTSEREQFYKMGFGKQIKYIILRELKQKGILSGTSSVG